MNIRIETKRLLIRPIEDHDVQGIFELDSDPAVHEFLGKKPIHTLAEAEGIVAYIKNQYITHGIGRWAVIDKASGDFIGWSGLKYETVLRAGMPYYDLGYRLKKNYWGQGIATETALLSLDYGFQTLNLQEIGGVAAIDNIASNTVLQKVGLQYKETFDYQGDPHHWYTLCKTEWELNRKKLK